MGPYHNYSPGTIAWQNLLIFGAGNAQEAARMDASGNVKQLRTRQFVHSLSSTVTAIDPVRGDLLVLSMGPRRKFMPGT